jgi:transposase-like protein
VEFLSRESEEGTYFMTKRTRRNHSAAFKAKVALEALKEETTVAEIAAKHSLHPNLVTQWKRAAVEGMASVFEKGGEQAAQQDEALTGELYKQIGQLKVENDFLARGLGRLTGPRSGR